MGSLPKDPVILLSVVNTKLRDFYDSLEAYCKAEDIDAQEIIKTLRQINYEYDAEKNKFI